MGKNDVKGIDYVSISGKFGYLCGCLSYVFSMAVPVFLMYYATESLALSAGIVGVMMMIVKLLDGVTDFLAGVMIDKTKSRTGKARPWFLRVAIPYGVVLALTFSIPTGWGNVAKLVALGIMYALTVSVFGTVVGVAKYALVPRMTDDPKQRSILGMIGDGCAVVVSTVLMMSTFTLVAVHGYTIIFVIYGVAACILSFLCYGLTKEKNEEISEMLNAKKEENSFKNLIKTLFTNKYALLVLMYVTILYIGCGIIQTGGMYFATYVCGDPGIYSRFMMGGLFGSIVGIFLGGAIVRKFGSKVVFAMGCLLAAAGYVGIIITNSAVPMVVIVCFFFIIMFSQVFTNTQLPVMVAAAADYGEWKNGVRTEGVTSGIVDIGTKIGQALAAAIFGFIMASGGFKEGGVEQTVEAVNSIKIGFLYVTPAIFAILGIIYIFTYKLEKKHPQIMKEIAERK